MTYKLKKLYNGFASVRSYTVDNTKGDLRLEYKGKTMTIPEVRLHNRFALNPQVFKSKFPGGKDYKLYDFKFIPDKEKEKQVTFENLTRR